MKKTMFQYFEWYLPNDGALWRQARRDAKKIAKAGFTDIWLPPAYKGSAGKSDVGYGVYDLYDLGEFRQKGSISTKYGTKKQYLLAVQALRKAGLTVLADIVFNHRMGADQKETIEAESVSFDNRNQVVEPLHEVEVWTRYTFPGRKGTYSPFVWDWTCFTGTDYDQKAGKRDLLLFKDKHWNNNVSMEQGNFDYIMGDDVDFSSPAVKQELTNWGKWYLETVPVDGFRLDAVKSIDSSFFAPWLQEMRSHRKEEVPAVGEYWSGDVNELLRYLDAAENSMMLFDVPLHFRLQHISNDPDHFDLRQVFDGTLAAARPDEAAVFVDNHDTQPGQALYSWVSGWFKPLAYALILLRQCKMPVIFYGDWYGIPSAHLQPVRGLREMLWIRSRLLSDWISPELSNDWQMSAWNSVSDHPVFVVMSSGAEKYQVFEYLDMKGRTFVDVMNPCNHVTIGADGRAEFTTPARSVSVYILEEDYRRMRKELRL